MAQTPTKKTSKTKPSAAELAAELRHRITSGKLIPNQRLVEVDIADEFGASRGNVRLALSELTMEGLVDRIQNRGAKVREITPEEAVEITQIRSAIESLCAAKAAERISDEQCAQLREVQKELTEAVENRELDRYSAANTQLHQTLIGISAMPIAAETIQRLRSQTVRQQFQRARLSADQSASLAQHVAIIDAVCNRDAAAAENAMKEHLADVALAIGTLGPNPA